MDFFSKADQLMEKGEVERALQCVESELPSLDNETKYDVADFYERWGLLEHAVKVLNELLEDDPSYTHLNCDLARVYAELGEDQKALELLNRIEEDDILNYTDALIQMADIFQAQGLYEVAEQKLLTAKEANLIEPKEVYIDLALAEFYFSIGSYHKAIIYYERLNDQKENIVTVRDICFSERLAESLAAIGIYEQALKYFQQSDRDTPDFLFKYGLTAYQAGREDLAIQKWEQVIELDRYYHSAYERLAEAYEKRNDIQKAYEIGLRGIQFDEFNPGLYYRTGKLAFQLEEFEESEFLLKEALKLDPGHFKAALSLVDLYKESQEYPKIIEMIHSLLDEEESLDPYLTWELARAYYHMEAYEKSSNFYKKAYDELSNNSDFLKEYGYFLVEEGELPLAINILKEYLTYEPHDEETREYIHRMEQS